MKLYVPVIDPHYDGIYVLGVFSTRELAQDTLDTSIQWECRNGNRQGRDFYPKIYEVVLDEPKEIS